MGPVDQDINNSIEISPVNLQQLRQIAIRLANIVKMHDVICLNGDLGSGKTTFAKYFIHALISQEIDVPSPTFTLVQDYKTEKFPIYHFDLYRLKSMEEAYEIGIEDAFDNGVSLIEWADIIKDLLPDDKININLNFAGSEEERSVTISFNQNSSSKILEVFNRGETI
jgi:tRNA threonylcarbamoyladenosine biosynthesis protein TsaE